MARKYAALLSTLLALAVITSAANVPLLFWSSQNSFAGQQKYHTEKLTGKDVTNVLSSLVDGKSSNGLFSAGNKPETVVVFVQPKASSAQIARLSAYAPLKTTFASAAASVAATKVSVEAGEISAAIDEVASVVEAAGGRVFRVTPQTLPELAELSNNGRVDLVIVSLEASAESASKTVSEVSSALGAASFVAVFTADESAEVQQTWGAQAVKPDWSKRYILQNETAPSNASAPVADNNNQPGFGDYFPPWFWEGFLAGIIFVWIAICGACTMMDMQTPDRFLTGEAKKKND